MTVSNFLKTDKDSVKWFVLHSSGHEGPYSLSYLEGKYKNTILDRSLKVWTEGLENPVFLEELLESSFQHETPLPPLPDAEIQLPPLPVEEVENQSEPISKKSHRGLFFFVISFGLIVFALYQWIKSQETFAIRRQARMSPLLHEKIAQSHVFEGWDKKIFFKEYVGSDLSRIWLVTSSFHHCHVEATFTSLDGKLLSSKTDQVQFKTQGELVDHVVEFSQFDFIRGNKIIPGLYSMSVEARDCKWSSWVAQAANFFQVPDTHYMSEMKVILYGKGAQEFNSVLDKLLKKKLEVELANQSMEELFWQDLQQKFQTLHAVSLQIEQLLLDLVGKDPKSFGKSVGHTINEYTKKYGHLLTRFVIDNEQYFKQLSYKNFKNKEDKRNYELILKTTAKKIGFESMRIIEDLQGLKKGVSKTKLDEIEKRIKATFLTLKSELNQNIVQTSGDRSP